MYCIQLNMHVIHDAKIIFYKKPVAWNCGRGYIKEKTYRRGRGALLPGLIGVTWPNHRKNSAKSRKNLNFHFCAVKQRMGRKYFKILSNALS